MTTDYCPECGADSAHVQCKCGQEAMKHNAQLAAAAERGAARRERLNMHAPGDDRKEPSAEDTADKSRYKAAMERETMRAIDADQAPQCGNCAYWRARMEGSRDGACHFAPPTPMIVGMSMPAGGAKLQGIPQQAPQPIVGSQFPPIGETGWCGCHRRRG